MVDSIVWGIDADQFHEIRTKIAEWNMERFNKRRDFLSEIAMFQRLEEHALLNLTHACDALMFQPNQQILNNQNYDDIDVYIVFEVFYIFLFLHFIPSVFVFVFVVLSFKKN